MLYGQELQLEFKDDPRREVKQALEDTFALIAYPDARESSLAPLLEVDGRTPVAEELNCAILGTSGEVALRHGVLKLTVLCPQSVSAGLPAPRSSASSSRRKFWSVI